MTPKKHTVILLRWVLIIAFSYLLLLDQRANALRPGLIALIAFVLASNLVVARMPDRWLESFVFDSSIVLFDAVWVTTGLLWAPTASSDLFLLYFLVIFLAAMGESLSMIVGSAVLVSLVYALSLSLRSGGAFQLTTPVLLRVPFLFVVALFYGYFVTELRGRRSEAAEAVGREQAKTELLASVSHDLRGPLGNAENLLALALDNDGQDPANRLLLLRAQVNIRRVSLLVTNLLQAEAMKAGQLVLQFIPVQLNDVVDEVFNLEAGAALLKKVTIRKEPDTELPVVTADMVQVGRMVANLVSNAIKYTGPGGAVVVRTACDADQVRVSVEDSGVGMTGEQCQALFTPYRRVHAGSSVPGTGLGLYIVQRLADLQGATVSVTSVAGKGSTFVIAFPRVKAVGAAHPVERQAEAALSPAAAAHAA